MADSHSEKPRDWDGTERRSDNHSVLYDLLKRMEKKLDALQYDQAVTREQLETHMKGEEHLISVLTSAFPDGDAERHCRYHKAEIKRLERQERFRDAVIEKSLSSLVWGGIVGLGAVLWQYIKDHAK